MIGLAVHWEVLSILIENWKEKTLFFWSLDEMHMLADYILFKGFFTGYFLLLFIMQHSVFIFPLSEKHGWSVKCWPLSPAVCLHVTVSHPRIINLLHALMTALLESGIFFVAMRKEFSEVCVLTVLIEIFK